MYSFCSRYINLGRGGVKKFVPDRLATVFCARPKVAVGSSSGFVRIVRVVHVTIDAVVAGVARCVITLPTSTQLHCLLKTVVLMLLVLVLNVYEADWWSLEAAILCLFTSGS